MEFFNEFHKQDYLRKKKEMEEWAKHPPTYEQALAQRKRNEELRKEMKKKGLI